MRFVEVKEGFIRDLLPVYERGEAEAIFDLALERVSGLEREEFSRKLKQQITLPAQEELQRILSRLQLHEPIQYILNEAWFSGLKFYVDKNVLIPRPETEELVEWIISDCRFPVDELSILDVGTGSGCIAISLKRRIRKASVSAIDISEEALTVAKKNSDELGTPVEFIPMDFLDKESVKLLGKFDVIVSNPPYIPSVDASTLDKNVVDHEPSEALFVPDDDAVIFYRALAQCGLAHLSAGGKIYAEIHPVQCRKVKEIFEALGYEVALKKDMQGKERMIRAKRDS